MALQMSRGTIRAWTDRPAPAGLLAVLTAVVFTMAGADGTGPQLAEVAIVGAVAAASLRAGAAGGLVAGLAGAAAHIAFHSSAGDWGRQGGVLSIFTVCSLITYGWLFGLVAARLHRLHAAEARPPAAAGAGGSQGLLTAAEGRAFLALEGQHARLFDEPPCILTVQMTVHDGVPSTSAAHALRAVARTFEASATARMHPVLFAENQLAMVMLGRHTEDLLAFERTLVDAMADATFADRESGTRPKASTVLRLDSSYLVLSSAPSKAEAAFSVSVSRRRDAATPVSVRAKAA
jgi:hypothetical protein